MMAKYFYILLFGLLAGVSKAFYIGTNLVELVEKSSVMAYGRIVSVDKETFKIVTLQPLKACKKNDTLTVWKFTDWSCGSRYSQYETGQEAVFCISSGKMGLYTMGGGNEGELIVRADTGYIKGYEQRTDQGRKISFISDYTRYISLPVKTITDGIKIYLDNLDAINRQLNTRTEGKVAYQYNYIDKLPKNDFLNLLIEIKKRGSLSPD